jgi:hypothetical protein
VRFNDVTDCEQEHAERTEKIETTEKDLLPRKSASSFAAATAEEQIAKRKILPADSRTT